MEERRIVWDENKNAENKLKHGIGFETARFIFADPERLWRLDRSEGNAHDYSPLGKQGGKEKLQWALSFRQ